jgi:hypothetical protein
MYAGGGMRLSSSRAATAAALVAGLTVLVVASRLLPTTPSLQHPATSTSAGLSAGTVRIIPLRDVPTAAVVGGVRVPNAIGHTLARATGVLHTAGLRGEAFERDPQIGTAVVVAQEPPARVLVPRGDVVMFRTRTDVQANGSLRRLRLGRDPTTTTIPGRGPRSGDPGQGHLRAPLTPRRTSSDLEPSGGTADRQPRSAPLQPQLPGQRP